MLEPIPFAGYVEIPDELTDAEILNVIKQTPFTDGYLNANLIKFARAILRKAQEK